VIDFSHGHAHGQTHKHSHRLTHKFRLIQELSHSHIHEIKQKIDHELSHNIALYLDDELSIYEQLEPKENDDDHNEDYDKPTDEYETGDTVIAQDYELFENYDIPGKLEKVAIQNFIGNSDKLENAIQCIDYFRIHGHFPVDTDPQIYKDFVALEKSVKNQKTPPVYPTFEVSVNGDRVEANAIPIGLNLKYKSGYGSFSKNAKIFTTSLRDRNKILNDLAYYILELLQEEFFRQKDFDTALRFLLPVPTEELYSLSENWPFTIDVKYLSKLGDLLVSCPFGLFPLNLFLPTKSQLVRIWAHFAIRHGISTRKKQFEWIRDQLEKRTKNWDSSDIRHKFFSPLKDFTIDNFKYAMKNTSKN
jgi:hypothetical protein